MPQMSPMWWTILMMFFIISSTLFFMNLYFQYSPKMNYKINPENKKVIWKW